MIFALSIGLKSALICRKKRTYGYGEKLNGAQVDVLINALMDSALISIFINELNIFQ